MKNILLVLILMALTTTAYFINEKENRNLVDTQTIISIKAQGYKLNFDKNWKLNNKKLDKDFIQSYLEILSGINIVKEASYSKKSISDLLLKYPQKTLDLKIGEKAFADTGFYLKVNGNWFLVKSDFTKDIIYKDDNDLAQRQYLMLLNLFKFTESQIKLQTP